MKNELATIFIRIETASAKVEDVAKQILAEIKRQGASSLDLFDGLVSAAYTTNGWSQAAGRPAADSTVKPAPDAVKLYVSTVRAAYRLELPVLTFETIGAMRQAIRQVRADRATHAQTAARPDELKGVVLASPDKLTGAVFHDVAVVWSHLAPDKQAELEDKIQRLIAQYSRRSPLVSVKKAA